eukprot:snap_masked-scaffold_29-processed-gene-2.40-mRNA-1 protein AED:0.09 eAED:0.09 QI:0/0/0/1/1/1/4/0/401
MKRYKILSKKGEGTFSEVLEAKTFKSGKFVAMKCMKNKYQTFEDVKHLKELSALRKLSPHPQIIKLLDILYDEKTGSLALVFELMHHNLYEFISSQKKPIKEKEAKNLLLQLFKGVKHMHHNGFFHRDLKPENILLRGTLLKLADLGSCQTSEKKQPFTEYISTRWYRAPECLLTDGYYSKYMDIWGCGCVMFELLALQPLFPGSNELDQIKRIHRVIGTPPQRVFRKYQAFASHMVISFPTEKGSGMKHLLPYPHDNEVTRTFLNLLLAYEPKRRISARNAVKHVYFSSVKKIETLRTQLHLKSKHGQSIIEEEKKKNSLPLLQPCFPKPKVHRSKPKRKHEVLPYLGTTKNKKVHTKRYEPYETSIHEVTVKKPKTKLRLKNGSCYLSPYSKEALGLKT